MNFSKEKALSEQIAEWIDLTDADLEEISTPEAGRIQGGWGGWGGFGSCSCSSLHVSARAFSSAGGFGSCSCGSCSCGSCSCGSCSCGSCSCGSCSCGSCEGWWD